MTVGVSRACPLFSKIIDRLAPISAETASALKAVGVVAVGRYLENLSVMERDALFAAGLGILPLSEAPSAALSADLGATRGGAAVAKAELLGAPAGVHLMVDFEAQNGTHADAIAYDTALTHTIAQGGFVPCAYVGQPQLLTGTELYMLPDVHLYWRGGSLDVPEPRCGFAIWQIPPLEMLVANTIVDVSATGADLRGRQPILWWPN